MDCIKCSAPVPEGGAFCPWCGANQAPEIKARSRTRANGLGTAYKNGSKWVGRATAYTYHARNAEGKLVTRQKRVTKTFKSKREALAWAASYRETDTDETPTLLNLWEGYSENDMTRLSADKQTAYKIARRRWEAVIGRRINTLTLDDLQRVVNEEAPTYYTAKDMRDLLSNLYKRAMASNSNNGRVSLNLARFLVLPELEEKETETFTAEEVSAIWRSYEDGDTFAGYILLLVYSGMMPAELLSCRKDQIDLDKCEIFGCGKKTSARKKTYAIVFPDFLRAVIVDLIGYKSGDKLLGVNKKTFYKQFYAALERAGVRKLPPYACRHTYATEAVKSSVPPAVVQQMLRHASLKTQERYTHLGMDAAHDAANAMRRETSG